MTPAPNGRPAEGNHEAANVDKIRDILFGGQMRDYEKHFARLEEQLGKETETLRSEMKKRLEGLEEYIHQELDALKQRLKTEKAERTTSVKDLERESRDSAKAAEKRFVQLEDRLSETTGDLSARLLEQSKKLGDEIQEKHHALAGLLNQEVQTLQSDKADRRTLAELLVEVAMRLRGEFELPENK